MQIFSPYYSIYKTAKSLDSQRLLKQVVEAGQVIDAVEKGTKWKNHPVVLAYRNYLPYVRLYQRVLCEEWILRGISKRGKPYTYSKLDRSQPLAELAVAAATYIPPFLGVKMFHESHRANLVRKAILSEKPYDIDYMKLWPDADPLQPYLWPQFDDQGYFLGFRVGTTKQIIPLSGKWEREETTKGIL